MAWIAKVRFASLKDSTCCNGSCIVVVVKVVKFLAKVAGLVIWPA